MFNNVRWQLALRFIAFSTAAYMVPTALALLLFYISLTGAIDRELTAFIASFGHAIKIVDGKPALREWARTVETNPRHSLVAYQLFDKNKHLVESHFPPGIPVLFETEREVSANGMTMRTLMTPLREAGEVAGYLQVQLPTNSRDDAVRQLLLITALISPVVLLGLGLSSYHISERATLQTRQTLNLLRQFVADASHELYTPLSIVQAAHESLAQSVIPAGSGKPELESSENALERMEKMLDDLMLLATMDAPRSGRFDELIDLSGLLEQLIQEFHPKFEQKRINLSLSWQSPSMIRGDRAALYRMFSNILDNAWKFTPSGGSVSVALHAAGQKAQIDIDDTGSGIPLESLPHIFDRFFRVHQDRNRSSGGTGLGLAIALATAQAHGGTIQADSILGKGSRFTVLLTADSRHKS